MKGGWACAVEALAGFHAVGAQPRRPVVTLATCDEETGSASSRSVIEGLADREKGTTPSTSAGTREGRLAM